MIPESVLWRVLSPLPTLPPLPALPERVDLLVVGAGYTGLAAARAAAQAGASVLVLEREAVGAGASSRNGGMVLPGYKAELADVARRHGLATARALWEDSLAAIGFVEALVAEEGIACDWHRPGHLTLAAKPAHLRALEASRRQLARDFGYETHLVGPADLGAEIGSRCYHGGLVDPGAGALQPAAYLGGLLAAAQRAGAVVADGIVVRRVVRTPEGLRVETGRGPVRAAEVLVATNGLTGTLEPWLARRVVPVGSFIVATAPLDADVAARLLPRRRMCSDTRNLLYYFRLSADDRLVFGGRAAFVPTALARSRALLQQGIREVFPDLGPVAIEHAWGGTLGFTLDHLPHAGRREGIGYSLGYGGHGVALASWLGHQAGRALAGAGPWPALAGLPFPAVPLYAGRPWFLPLAGAYYQVKDWLA